MKPNIHKTSQHPKQKMSHLPAASINNKSLRRGEREKLRRGNSPVVSVAKVVKKPSLVNVFKESLRARERGRKSKWNEAESLQP
jgi:hypothetical protein